MTLRDGLAAAVRDAGALALTYFRNSPKTWDKRSGDPVSEADLAVDALLRERLAALDPAAGLMSEETKTDRHPLPDRRLWVVDPIDGTRAFIAGRDEFSVSVALVEQGTPVLAAVFNPARQEAFLAAKGEGATLNDKIIRVTQAPGITGAQLLMGERSAKRLGWLSEYGQPEIVERIAFVNSIAYRLALVACGRFDGLIALGHSSDWDIAAGALLVAEAGGTVTDREGGSHGFNRPSLRHDGTVAAGPTLHPALLEAAKRLPR